MIIEFAGLPRSGKSSGVGIARDYFLRRGYKVRLIAERAILCPFSNQHRVEFAQWVANRASNSVLEAALCGETDMLFLQDRGLFDALAFYKLLYLEGYITEEALNDFMRCFANSRWTQLVDLVILFDISHEAALERDLASKLTAGPGVITNLETMQRLTTAYDYVMAHFGGGFPRIERLDTTRISPIEAARKVIEIVKKSLYAQSSQAVIEKQDPG